MYLSKLLLFCLLLHANEAVVWKIEGRDQAIYFDKKLQVWMSITCEKNSCGARKFIEKARTLNLVVPPEDSSQNPGSIYCSFLKGVVLMGVNERGSQNAFCEASDKTMVDLASLSSWAHK